MLPAGRAEETASGEDPAPAAGEDPVPEALNLPTGILEELRNRLALCFGMLTNTNYKSAPATEEVCTVRTVTNAINIARPQRQRDRASKAAPRWRERGAREEHSE